MNSHLLLTPNEKLREWKDFRDNISKIDNIEQQLIETQHYWDMHPQVFRSIDLDQPQDWLSPWDMVFNDICCPLSKPYLMEQTLILTNLEHFTPEMFRLMYIENKSIPDAFMVLVYDNKYVLNYEHGQLINFDIINDTCVIIQEYTTSIHHKHYIKK